MCGHVCVCVVERECGGEGTNCFRHFGKTNGNQLGLGSLDQWAEASGEMFLNKAALLDRRRKPMSTGCKWAM